MGIYEFIPVTTEVQIAVGRRADAAELVRIARAGGYRNLREDGLIKASRGETSLDEVLRVTGLEANATP
jgi:general secretion pathway protein E